MTQTTGAPHADPSTQRKHAGIPAIASLVLGILSVLSAAIGVVAIVSIDTLSSFVLPLSGIPKGLPGLILGIIALATASRRGRTKGQAVVGVVLCAVGSIVVPIVAFAAGVGTHIDSEDRPESTQRVLRMGSEAVQMYCATTGCYPSDSRDSASLVADLQSLPRSRRLLDRIPPKHFSSSGRLLDGWGNEVAYEQAGSRMGGPVLISAGPDGIMQTRDDIHSGN